MEISFYFLIVFSLKLLIKTKFLLLSYFLIVLFSKCFAFCLFIEYVKYFLIFPFKKKSLNGNSIGDIFLFLPHFYSYKLQSSTIFFLNNF